MKTITPDPKNPQVGDEYSTSKGTVVVYAIEDRYIGDNRIAPYIRYYIDGEQRGTSSLYFMLRSLASVTPIDRE